MPNVPISCSVKFNKNDIEKIIKQELFDQATATFLLNQASLEARLKDLIANTLRASNTLQELLGGPLQGELGIESPGPIIDQIIRIVTDSLTVNFKIFKSFKTITTITCQPKDYINLLNENFARYVSVNKNNGNYLIDWLYWLLFEGDRIIISNFHSVFGSFPHSRSKMAIMKPGGAWRMPVAHAGSVDDNFITRAIGLDDSTFSNFKSEFDRIFKEEIIDRM